MYFNFWKSWMRELLKKLWEKVDSFYYLFFSSDKCLLRSLSKLDLNLIGVVLSDLLCAFHAGPGIVLDVMADRVDKFAFDPCKLINLWFYLFLLCSKLI